MTREVSEADTLPGGSRIGEVVAGKYRLERLIGRGGMGEVYEARHVVVGRRFAIKFLHAHLAVGSNAASRFLREAQTAGSLDSQHIAAVLDFDTAADGSPFLVMEYLTGESLATTLRREGRLPRGRALAILLQVCEGLEVAHRAGIVHRDLKPDNLLLSPQKDGTDLVKILDFGIAKLLGAGDGGNVTQSGAVLGTPFYMAPEQARGDNSIDLRVDVYALGVLAYELFSGKKPHPGDSYNSILAHILTQPITPLSELCAELPDALVSVVQQALAYEPAQRPASAALLARKLAPFAGHEVKMNDSHFDLRPSTASNEGTATRATTEASTGTLSSAVGDVPGSRAEPASPRRARWLVLAIAVPAAATLIAIKTRDAAPPSPPRETVASSSQSGATSTSELTPLPVASAPSAIPSTSSATPSRPSKKTPTPRRKNSAETSFDEKNPY